MLLIRLTSGFCSRAFSSDQGTELDPHHHQSLDFLIYAFHVTLPLVVGILQ